MHELSLKIYNAISDTNHNIDWYGFEFLSTIYEVDDPKELIEYILLIKDTILNFDKKYSKIINNDKMKDISNYISKNTRKRK